MLQGRFSEKKCYRWTYSPLCLERERKKEKIIFWRLHNSIDFWKLCVCVYMCVCVCIYVYIYIHAYMHAYTLSFFSRVQPWTHSHGTLWTVAPRLLCPWILQQEHWSGWPCLLQGTFPSQGSNPQLPQSLQCRWVVHHWATSHWGSLRYICIYLYLSFCLSVYICIKSISVSIQWGSL